ncbi:MAG: holo-ACP synthase [Alphaproteobacteria bacterium]|jgi:holo-[acyl-carrier protein] synthase|tara:strand:- start:3275 stop:3685 length:411 start_codon:yes stop_codon:yes gene_type:complete
MILGIGTDLIDIRRIESTLSKFGDRFINRIFTANERIKCETKLLSVESYSKRYAAKEACAKALGTGFRKGVYWSDIEVANDNSGKPTLNLTGGAAVRLENITPNGMYPSMHISLTDEYPYAQATVVIYAIPDNDNF